MPVFKSYEDAPNALQKLLLFAVPPSPHGHKSINHLAKLLKVNRWSVQKWIINQRIPPQRAAQVVDLSEGRVSLADFSRYVYGLNL